MKKLSKLLTCLVLVLVVGLAVVFTACGEEEVVAPETPKYSVIFYQNRPGVVFDEKTAPTFNVLTVEEGKGVNNTLLVNPQDDKYREPGYNFVGWFTAADGGIAFDFDDPYSADDSHVKITGKTQVFARWESNGLSTDVAFDESAPFSETKETVFKVQAQTDGEGKSVKDAKGNIVYEQVSSEVSTGIYTYNAGAAEDGAIPYDTPSFNFKDKGFDAIFNTKASYTIYNDEDCLYVTRPIVTLESGDNYFYVKVTAEDAIVTKVYKINIVMESRFKVSVKTLRGSTTSVMHMVAGGTKITAPAILDEDGDYIYRGYSPNLTAGGEIAWKYRTAQKRDAAGNIIDADGIVLQIFEGEYYCVNTANFSRIPVKKLIKGQTYTVPLPPSKRTDAETKDTITASSDVYFIELDGVMYITDKDGNFTYESDTYQGEKLSYKKTLTISENALWESVVNAKGLLVYKKGTPVANPYEYLWSFDMPVNDNIEIYLDWTPNTYTLTLDKNSNEAVYNGTTTSEVTYGIEKDSLASIVSSLNSDDPYFSNGDATFIGWFDAREGGNMIVGPKGKAVLGWNIDSNATLYAQWKYKTFPVEFKSANTEMGTVSGSGECELHKSITGTATPATGYRVNDWYINTESGKIVLGTGNTLNYALDTSHYNEIKKKVEIYVSFVKITVTVNLNYGDDISGLPENAPESIIATYGNPIYLATAVEGVLPVMDGDYGVNLFDGWYYRIPYVAATHSRLDAKYLVDVDGDSVTDFVKVFIANGSNTAVSGEENWHFTNNQTLYIEWILKKYTVTALSASYENTLMGNIEFTTGFGFGETTISMAVGKYSLNGRSILVDYNTLFEITRSEPVDADLYRFTGWYQIDLSLDNPLATENMTLLSADSTEYEFTLGDEDITIVAMWYYNPVKVYLDKGIDEEVAYPEGVLHEVVGDTLKYYIYMDLNTTYASGELPVLEDLLGWSFDGWYLGSIKYIDMFGKTAENMELTNPTLIINTLTLTAKWETVRYYTVDEASGLVNGLTNSGEKEFHIEIKPDINIKGIAAGAFEGNKTIQTITIHGNITSIGANAFKDSNIKTVIFADNFRSLTVGADAFANCTSLLNINFPSATTSVALGALRGCNKLEEITYPGTWKLGTMFSEEEPTIIGFYSALQEDKSYWIPVSLKKVTLNSASGAVAAYALSNCTYVNEVVFASVKEIGNYAFQSIAKTSATPLNVDLSYVEKIGFFAFENAKLSGINLANINTVNDGAFKNSTVTSVIVGGRDFDTIPSECFYGCTELVSISMPAIYGVYSHAFYGCTKLTKLAATGSDPTAITSVGTYAFYGSGLNAFAVSGNLSNVTSVGRYAFHNTVWYNGIDDDVFVVGSVLYYNKDATAFSFTSNTSITSIADGAFAGSLLATTSLNLTNMSALKSIGSEAFKGSNIESITLPASIQNIYIGAFENCTSLSTVDMSLCDKLIDIGESAFANCYALGDVEFHEFIRIENYEDAEGNPRTRYVDTYNETQLRLRLNDKAFMNCASLSSITLPKNLGYLGNYSFQNSGVSTVNFVDSAKFEEIESADPETPSTPAEYTSYGGLFTSIGVGAFMNTRIENISIPFFVSTIGAKAFKDCPYLESVHTVTGHANSEPTVLSVIGDEAFSGDALFRNITVCNGDLAYFYSLGIGAFENCSSLEIINFGNELTVIPDRAFSGCSNLISITTGLLSRVGAYAFRNCRRLGSISSVTSVGDYAFQNCESIKTFTLVQDGSVKRIGDYAFAGCKSITSIIIPMTISEIGDGAFSQCELLGTVNFTTASSLTKIGIGAFSGTRLTSVTLGNSVTSIGANAFMGCNDLKSVTLGTGVKTIGANAFANCTDITLTLKGTTVPVLAGAIFTEGAVFEIRVPTSYKIFYTDESSSWVGYADYITEY